VAGATTLAESVVAGFVKTWTNQKSSVTLQKRVAYDPCPDKFGTLLAVIPEKNDNRLYHNTAPSL
jgi:hypothetical protein